MAKKTKETKEAPAKTTTPVAKTAAPAVTAAPVATSVAPAKKADLLVTTPVAAAPKSVTPVAAAPVKTEAPVAQKTVAPVAAAPTTKSNGNTPVAVQLNKAGKDTSVKAVIRYQGPLANVDKLVAVVGCEWFAGPRWQGSKDVEMKKSRDGAFEAELELTNKDARGQALMALQLAFTTPTRQTWDSAGVPYGYYQVSALDGHVETVRQ